MTHRLQSLPPVRGRRVSLSSRPLLRSSDPSATKTKFQVLPYWLLFLGLLFTVSVGSAHAQALAPPAYCDADEQCNLLANEAADSSQAGRFDDVERAYKAAYAKQPDTKLLFNLARVLHKAGRLQEAMTYYQQYLDAGAEGSKEQRIKAQQRLEEAQQSFAAAAGKPKTPGSPY